MPRPKGCTCGTPKPCKIHPRDDRAMAGSTPARATEGDTPGGRAQGGSIVDSAEPFLRAIEGAGAGDAKPAGDLKPAGSKRRRKPDPRPKPRERTKPVAPDKPDDAALQQMLGELLTLPAIPMAMLANCDYCRDHFIYEGPKAARELVALSLTNPALRGALESIHTAWSRITIAGVLAGYLAKPLMHHVAPEPVLQAAGPVLGVPPRPPKPKPHTHDAPGTPPEHASPHAEEPDPEAAPDQHAGASAA